MKKFEKWLIATDLDGTLYEKENQIPKRNIDAVNYFISEGGLFTVATGRPICSTEKLIDGVQISCPAITCNGQAVYDFNSRKTVFASYYDESVFSAIADVMQKFPSVGVELYSELEDYIIRENEYTAVHFRLEPNLHRTNLLNVPIGKLCKIIFSGNADDISEVYDYMKNKKFKGFYIVRTDPKYAEFQLEGTSKGIALKYLAEKYEIPENHICAIGNYYNDAPLIESAHIGALVCGAPADMLPLADYVTTSSCEQGALAEFIEYIGQIADTTD
jgi:Cof subfamily protein (haloacid dehalogenase superfamily)